MKTFILVAALLLSNAFAANLKTLQGKLYVAQGFDDNDSVEITVVGTIPNTCYKNPGIVLTRNQNKIEIHLTANYVKSSKGCRNISMAHQETINLGPMPQGEYELELMNQKRKEVKLLNVKEARNSMVDDFHYGNVTGIVENEFNREVDIVGVNPVDCLQFDKLSTEIQDSMIVIRPRFKEVGECDPKVTPFKIKYEVPYLSNQAQGILLHVRIMNGRSYNYFYQNHL